ncbi:MAG: rhodanese-like domain-containing protein [Candidatus Pristimantibacillus sp.]
MNTSTLINIIIVIAVIWFAYTRFKPMKGLRHLQAEQFRAEVEQTTDALLIDVREPAEFKSGYIHNARNIPLSQLKNRMGEIPQDSAVFLYCRSGMRSQQAARILQKNKYSNLTNLQGGIMSWKGKIQK